MSTLSSQGSKSGKYGSVLEELREALIWRLKLNA